MQGKYTRNVSFLIIFFIIFGLLAIWQPKTFLSIGNFQSMAFQIPEFGILALAMTLSILAGGIDLSIISITILSGITSGFVFESFTGTNVNTHVVIVLAVFAALLVSSLCGFINGLLVGWGKLTPILVTLGTSRLFTGTALVLTKGGAKTNFPDMFIHFGNGTIKFIPNIFILFLFIALIISLILNGTKFGFNIYMVGNNPLVSIFTGIKNKIVLIKVYTLVGLICGIAALTVMAKTSSIKVGYGTSYLLQSVLVAILGGVDPAGGFGTITGVLLGIFLLQIISSGFNLLGLSAFLRNVIWGALLIAVMMINYFINKNSKNKIK
ncbi:MAG: ABC transporter permease [Actinobacteria bacterium]|nr:ABC transporter permease [Actinomycetota bacterium]